MVFRRRRGGEDQQDAERDEVERLATVLARLELSRERRAALMDRYLSYAGWLDHAARHAQRTHYTLRMTALVGGILLPAVAGLDAATGAAGLRWVTAGLGVVVGASAALDGFLNARERWFHYRRATEELQAELWQFALLNGKRYERTPSHEAAFPALADACEQFVLAEVAAYLAGPAQAVAGEAPTPGVAT